MRLSLILTFYRIRVRLISCTSGREAEWFTTLMGDLRVLRGMMFHHILRINIELIDTHK